MHSTIAQSVGMNISKDTLDVHLHPDGTARRFANNLKGFSTLIVRGAKPRAKSPIWSKLQNPVRPSNSNDSTFGGRILHAAGACPGVCPSYP